MDAQERSLDEQLREPEATDKQDVYVIQEKWDRVKPEKGFRKKNKKKITKSVANLYFCVLLRTFAYFSVFFINKIYGNKDLSYNED